MVRIFKTKTKTKTKSTEQEKWLEFQRHLENVLLCGGGGLES